MFYSKCPYCGSNNDPGEKCECQKEKNTAARKIHSDAYNGAFSGEYMKTYSVVLGKGLPSCIANTVESALRQDKNIYFIAKLDLADYESSFIYEDNYKKVASRCGKEIQTINLDANPYRDKTALDYLRRVFPDSYLEPTPDEQQRILDGSIEIVAPFVSREDEFNYVVNRISGINQSLRQKYP